MNDNGREHMIEFDYLRAVAIILVVLGHSVYSVEGGFPIVLENIFKGGAALFVFISGFFFHAIFYRGHFKYTNFILKKTRNVFLPFIFISAAIIIFYLLVGMFLEYDYEHFLAQKLQAFFSHGYILYPHWYVRFIMTVFLLSPLYIKFVQIDARAKILILAISSIISAVLHRPTDDVDVIQSVLYFSPYYLFGITYSVHNNWFNRHNKLVLSGSIFGFFSFLSLQSFIFIHAGNYHKSAFQYAGIDFMFFQKISLCLALVYLFRSLDGAREHSRLKMIAEASFAIFFIHAVFTKSTITLLSCITRFTEHNVAMSVGLTLAIFMIAMVGSLAVASSLRSMLGNRSRLFIGW